MAVRLARNTSPRTGRSSLGRWVATPMPANQRAAHPSSDEDLERVAGVTGPVLRMHIAPERRRTIAIAILDGRRARPRVGAVPHVRDRRGKPAAAVLRHITIPKNASFSVYLLPNKTRYGISSAAPRCRSSSESRESSCPAAQPTTTHFVTERREK